MDNDVFAPGFGQAAQPAREKKALTIAELNAFVTAHYPMRGLKEWRLARGWSQFEAAKRLEMSLSTWIRYETKGVPSIKLPRLVERMERIGCSK